MIMVWIMATSQVLLFCYIGAMISVDLSWTGQYAFNINWYKLPIKQQKFIKMIIIFSQIDRTINGYGIFDCNIRAFIQVSI